MLTSRDRVRLPVPVGAWRRSLLRTGLREVPVDGTIGIHAIELESFHADPSDRIITATAALNNAVLITADRRILDWPGTLSRFDARR